MGVLLKQVADEVKIDELKAQLHRIGSAFLHHRKLVHKKLCIEQARNVLKGGR